MIQPAANSSSLFPPERPHEEKGSDEDNSVDGRDDEDDGDDETEEEEEEGQTPTAQRRDVGTSVSYHTIPRYSAFHSPAKSIDFF